MCLPPIRVSRHRAETYRNIRDQTSPVSEMIQAVQMDVDNIDIPPRAMFVFAVGHLQKQFGTALFCKIVADPETVGGVVLNLLVTIKDIDSGHG